MEKLLFGIFVITVFPAVQCRGRNYISSRLECGPFGFVCDGITRVRICEEGNVLGPSFRCPSNTVCNEESTDVCESTMNYIDPIITRNIRCYRNERLADTSVPGCKGYIMCIPNKNRFQGLKFQCSGQTIFNGFTRACTSPEKYKCPLTNSTVQNKFYSEPLGNRRPLNAYDQLHKPIECENYKFAVTSEDSPSRVTYFCPQRPAPGESKIRCTVFSNSFCLALERDDEDQFLQGAGSAFRKPRNNN
ncbi:unnamed protein product [Pieris brassicae]|uniref:Chitin-binding type-2 domain-containing protein n=1 Tax=Pieris brassicae TaxID=7116 RepID=A0A9P0T074_PIEBR|nr:unnamed protein product [Pieris brassicae]